jgi:hypothetical protein
MVNLTMYITTWRALQYIYCFALLRLFSGIFFQNGDIFGPASIDAHYHFYYKVQMYLVITSQRISGRDLSIY